MGSKKDNCIDDIDNPHVAEIKYEYLDHTADIQLHGWGSNIEEAFEQTIMSMFAYMSGDISEIENCYTFDVTATGHDMKTLLFNLLNNFLYNFTTEPYFIPKIVKVLEFDRNEFKIVVRGYGESFDTSCHSKGAEVKAITFSNMQIHESSDKADVFVIIDI
ncbi:Protein archease [Strongyloides ratti]|uniref:Protein archease n=1 Tax=Strongyloides ratti TaxID=34506 RepID=A0A090L7D1_STRRB|nr:Protein archease [Strongyloides ratti]CEF65676.1 Protein archease [Strongyloides ratti]